MSTPKDTRLTDALKRDEGFRAFPYRDTVGKLTIGYGRNLDDVGISQAEAEMLLTHDIAAAAAHVAALLPWTATMSPTRFAVLVNMAFNLGAPGLLDFRHALEAMRLEQWDKAADEMLASRWAEQTGDRARRLAAQMRTDSWT